MILFMKIEIDTKEDSHEEIQKVIRLLQHLVGDQEVFSNSPSTAESEATTSVFNNIFGDNSPVPETAPSAPQEAKEEPEEVSESTEDLFAELFSEDELKKMEPAKEDEEEIKTSKKKYSMEFY